MYIKYVTAVLAAIFTIPLAFAYIDDSPDISAPGSAEDKGVIVLDAKEPTYNLWKTLRDRSKDPKREPGLIHVQRYVAGPAQFGIPTFFKLPIALTPEDLKVGKVDVAIMGAGLDFSGGMRGAAYGPNALRTSGKYLPYGVATMPHMHTMVNPFKELVIADYGDAQVDILSTERSMGHIRDMVKNIAKTGTIPMIVGGDHSLMYPDVAGLADVYGKSTIGVVHFDAHYDASKRMFGHLISHGQPVYRLIHEGHVKGKNFIQVGLRGYYPDEDAFKWMRKQGFRYHTMAEVEKKGWPTVMKRVLKEAREGTKYLFISLDIDVLDPAFTPGTGTPEPAGLTTRELFPLIRGLCAENDVIGFELVELNPLADPGYTTALNSNRLLRECLTGIAMRKKGIKDGSYLSPLSVDHGN